MYFHKWKSVQNYCFFIIYANFCAEKCNSRVFFDETCANLYIISYKLLHICARFCTFALAIAYNTKIIPILLTKI